MRDKYWALFTEIKHYEQYYENYQIRAKRFNALINGTCLIFSLGSVAGWSIWKVLPFLWGLIIAFMQLIAVLNSLFPFSQQIAAIKFLVPQITKLFNRMAHDWDKTYQLSESKISDLTYRYQTEFDDLESQYTNDVYFPHNAWCAKMAEIECKNYFKHHYNVG